MCSSRISSRPPTCAWGSRQVLTRRSYYAISPAHPWSVRMRKGSKMFTCNRPARRQRLGHQDTNGWENSCASRQWLLHLHAFYIKTIPIVSHKEIYIPRFIMCFNRKVFFSHTQTVLYNYFGSVLHGNSSKMQYHLGIISLRAKNVMMLEIYFRLFRTCKYV